MQTIHKHVLDTDVKAIVLPAGSQILSVDSQQENIVAYALVDPEDSRTEEYVFLTIGTGAIIEQNLHNYTFLGTAKLLGGSFMFHIFYKKLT